MRDQINSNEAVDSLLSTLEELSIIPFLIKVNPEAGTESELYQYSDFEMYFLCQDEKVIFSPEELYHLLKDSALCEYDSDRYGTLCMNIHARLLFVEIDND